MEKEEMAIKAAMQKVMDANLTNGMKLVIEVEDVLGTNIYALNVEAHGGTKETANAAFIKLLLSASFRNPWLKELIKATATTFDYVHVDGVEFMGDPKGGSRVP